jgi:predicted amidophosphoribosyltransferase
MFIDRERISGAILDLRINFLGSRVRHWKESQKDYCRECPNEIERWNTLCEQLSKAENADARRSLQIELHSTDYYWSVGRYLEMLQNELNLLKLGKQKLIVSHNVIDTPRRLS